MPILQMSGLPQKHPERISQALKVTALALAEIYGCDPKHVWVTWRTIEPDYFVEGDQAAQMQPDQTQPPIGQLFCYGKHAEEAVKSYLEVAARTLGEALGLGDNVFITYHEVAPGSVFDGGGVR